MKRSEINLRIREGIAFFDRMGFKLPPFAFFTREDWQKEAADTAELDAQIQLEQMKAMQIRQMEEESEENHTPNPPIVPAYNQFKTETEELNRIFANAYDFTFQYSEPQVDGMEIRRAMNISFTADSFDHAVSMLHEVVEGPYRCLI